MLITLLTEKLNVRLVYINSKKLIEQSQTSFQHFELTKWVLIIVLYRNMGSKIIKIQKTGASPHAQACFAHTKQTPLGCSM